MKQYYAVVYCKDGTIHLWPGKSKEDCMEKLTDMKHTEGVSERMESTTVINRDLENCKDGYIFGHPKCLDVMSSNK